jgi:hypothetical protein
MVSTRALEPPDLVVVRLSGLITASDQAALVAWVRDALRQAGDVRLLVFLDEFEGWKAESSFDDAALWLQDHDRVTRMAIVGDEAWRIPTLTFIAQPLRRIPIEYFATETDARRWLGRHARDASFVTST